MSNIISQEQRDDLEASEVEPLSGSRERGQFDKENFSCSE